MMKGTFLITAAFILFSAALTACSISSSASEAPGQGSAEQSQEGMAPAQGDAAPDTAQDGNAYHRITAEEAKAMIDKGGVTVVDVRREDEYAAGHIPGSILVPNEEISDTPPEALPDLDAILLVHCRTGIRSKQASDQLVELGYKNVYDFGGIADWPYETAAEE